MANTLGANPVRDVQPIGLKRRPTGATALSADDLHDLLVRLRADDHCQRNDLVDPITVLIATRLRRSELLALRWTDFDETKQTIAATGNVVRILPRLLGSRRAPAVDGTTAVISPMHG
ncbi:integrase [Mycobacterium marinum]|uniref:integrase n=1 Tax=Mycobacterium marinum TaxID=1781 RepID=UPI001922C067|nr:integrase [Mycobacterium marinum]QQW36515.1 integrase [Mycobacterium marinum]